ncbi:polysialyltransferase family glycosyltransferase [Streptomyces malaysiensis]|uniref:polysialyltransferase family glycosyltransferase n=1 Tax=Streptomyces malaysiensis TaxID=92644 RepID=UPI0011CEB4BF|nr:polysialyltransferase family glycosyltransferase [Streptomyces sp. NA07423]MCC4318256.1 alpha-2,8-polysialyltransferase family protein [Streptomyces malaysiensis]MCQ6249174.1 alpha-2,8-polysialyltransferase family protein [Streptomyces malaysiensis]WHX20417.1 polysialyltransferase family glycosyltransferase [Streptomyces sp. NA07423]
MSAYKPLAERKRTQIFLASTLYGAATLAAAIDAGGVGPADRRLLLVSNNAATPETTPPVDEMPGFERLRGRFDRVLSWNEAISPFHPGGWAPRPDDAPLWERHLRLLWNLGDDNVELVLESIQVNPAMAIANVFQGAPIDVYADGLMSYGPTRNKLDPLIGTRIRRLLHLDLVPGLRPLLLTEFGVEPEILPTEVFTKVLAEVADAAPRSVASASERIAVGSGPAMMLGQYLSALDILTPQEEEELHVRMLRGAVALGHRTVVFKPHPTAPARWSRMLEKKAAELGAELTVMDTPVLAEVLYQRMRPALVIGCFSTALLTADVFYGLPVAKIGTDVLLERLTPYQNSNRMPVTIVDALLPDLEDHKAVAAAQRVDERAGKKLTGLVAAVGFCMQAKIYPDLRPVAERYLAAHLDNNTWRYFKKRRLTALALPGAVPSQLAFIPRNETVRRVARRARALKRAALKRTATG